jgi:hypothetical protein
MATTMLCPSWSVLRLQSNIITNEQTTQLAKRPICPRPPERLGALVSAFLSAAPLLTRSNIHRRDSLPAVSCNAGFCNAPEARCLTSTMLMALQKPHRSANRRPLDEGNQINSNLLRCICRLLARSCLAMSLSAHDPDRTSNVKATKRLNASLRPPRQSRSALPRRHFSGMRKFR